MVTSPNYPSNYPNDLQQTSTIEVKEGLHVYMRFTIFDVESHSTCSNDYVTIKNGEGTTLMEKTCGSSLPAIVISTSKIVEIYFHTDSSTSRSGWVIFWIPVTPGAQSSLSKSDYPPVWALADLLACLITEKFDNCNAPLLTSFLQPDFKVVGKYLSF